MVRLIALASLALALGASDATAGPLLSRLRARRAAPCETCRPATPAPAFRPVVAASHSAPSACPGGACPAASPIRLVR
jgi:hypothetical protein